MVTTTRVATGNFRWAWDASYVTSDDIDAVVAR